MDIARALTFVTEDDDWLMKLGIGAVVSFFSWLILPAFLLGGYLVAVARNVAHGKQNALPAWDDWGQLFMDGLYVFIAQLVYTLPFWLLTCIATVATVGLGGIGGISEEAAAVGGAGIVAVWGIAGCLGLLFLVAIFFISPAIIIQYVLTGDFGALFRFGQVLGIARDNLGQILIVALISIAISFVLSAVLGIFNIIPCLGTIISVVLSILFTPWILAVTGHLYGQIAANAGGKLPPKMAY